MVAQSFNIDKMAVLWYKTSKFNWRNTMERKICLLFVLFISTACGPAWAPTDTDVFVAAADASVAVDSFVGPTDEEIIMANYEADVAAYQEDAGMSPEWVNWMIEKKDWWSKAYIRPRRNSHDVRIYVRYENPIAYTPAWASEAEHFGALELMAELQYPGWNFTFLEYSEGDEERLEGNDAIAILGGRGTSSASGRTIYLVYETIFAHEYGHTLGLHHHYCGGTGLDQCPENFPPGEGKCIMARNIASFGPTENSFLLLTTGERQDDAINAIVADINGRYPEGYGSKPWNECGMDK